MVSAHVIWQNHISTPENSMLCHFSSAVVGVCTCARILYGYGRMDGRILYGDAQVNRPARAISAARHYAHIQFQRIPSSRL